jgi:hypothetical protein
MTQHCLLNHSINIILKKKTYPLIMGDNYSDGQNCFTSSPAAKVDTKTTLLPKEISSAHKSPLFFFFVSW